MVRQRNFANARNGQSRGRGKNAKGNDNSSERFRLTVAIGMGGIGWTRGKSQPAPNDDRTRTVEGGFDPIRDERVSISKNAGRDLDECKRHIDREPDQSQPGAGLQIARSSATGRMSIHAEGND
jgi:hypothetical protein